MLLQEVLMLVVSKQYSILISLTTTNIMFTELVELEEPEKLEKLVEIAKALAKAGATICFNDLKQEFVDKGLAAYEAEGIKAHGYVCNVCDEEGVQAMVAKIEEEVGVIDILVNNGYLFMSRQDISGVTNEKEDYYDV